MADFTLSAPGNANNPWNPGSIVVLHNSMQSDAAGFFETGFTYGVFAHDANYGSVITATVTVAVSHAVDEIYVGAAVRSGANAGCMIHIQWNFNGSAIIRTCTPAQGDAGGGTNISSALTVPTINNGDVLSCTVTLSGGVATVTGSQAGNTLAFTGSNTTSTFATESSLAAGWAFSPQNTNATRAGQFTGTGVAGGVAPAPPVSNTVIFMGSYPY